MLISEYCTILLLYRQYRVSFHIISYHFVSSGIILYHLVSFVSSRIISYHLRVYHENTSDAKILTLGFVLGWVETYPSNIHIFPTDIRI